MRSKVTSGHIDTPDEIKWKDSHIYGEQYQVSNTGLVRNKFTGHVLAAAQDKKGYLKVRLSLHDKKVSVRVHRMVAIAFIPNPENLPQVNHKDGNKKNNHVSNLEWASNYDNMQHAICNGLINRSENAGRDRRSIAGTDKNGTTVVFESLASAVASLNISKANLCNALKGKRKRCGGYSWKYIEEGETK